MGSAVFDILIRNGRTGRKCIKIPQHGDEPRLAPAVEGVPTGPQPVAYALIRSLEEAREVGSK